jgi:hypothetical protein
MVTGKLSEPKHTIVVGDENFQKLSKLKATKWGEIPMDFVITHLLQAFGDQKIDPRVHH